MTVSGVLLHTHTSVAILAQVGAVPPLDPWWLRPLLLWLKLAPWRFALAILHILMPSAAHHASFCHSEWPGYFVQKSIGSLLIWCCWTYLESQFTEIGQVSLTMPNKRSWEAYNRRYPIVQRVIAHNAQAQRSALDTNAPVINGFVVPPS